MKTPSRSVAWDRVVPPATLLLLSLLAAAPLWGPGLLNTRGGGDSPFLLQRTHQLLANLRAGVFPVRWMPDAAYGFGYPFFNYYAALPYYVAAGLGLLGFDVLTAVKLTQTVFLAIAALTMYGWAGHLLRHRSSACLAAAAYTVAPFHLVNLYVRGDSLSEFAAFALYPLILWGFDRLAARPSVTRALAPTLAYAALIVTHNVSALIFSPFLLIYVTFHLLHRGRHASPNPPGRTARRLVVLLSPILGALLLSAWFWVPALAEAHHVQLDAQTTGYFFYGNHFRGTNLLQRTLIFDYSDGQWASSPFAMGLPQAVLALIGALVVALDRAASLLSDGGGQARRLRVFPKLQQPAGWRLGFSIVCFLVATWLMTPLSRILWDHLPLLPMVQFPWRFLSIQSLFAAVLAGAACEASSGAGVFPWITALLLAAVLVAASLIGLDPDYLPITGDEVTEERLKLYELFSGNIGSTIRHEYLPRWVEPRPYVGASHVVAEASPRPIPISGEIIRAERLLRRPTARHWHLEAGEQGSRVAFPLYYWPGWYALVDGKRAETQPISGSGYLSADVPPGEHVVELHLGRTPIRLAAEATSLAATIALIGLAARASWLGRKRRGTEMEIGQTPPPTSGGESGRDAVLSCLPFVVLLSLIVVLQPQLDSAAEDDLTMDFEHKPYLHHNPEGLPLDGRQLIGYEYKGHGAGSTSEVQPGEALTVALQLASDQLAHDDKGADDPTHLRLLSPAAVRHPRIPALAEIDIPQDLPSSAVAATTTVSIPIPIQAGPGVHLLQVTEDPPFYLRPVWVAQSPALPEDGTTARATFAKGALRLHDVRAEQPSPDQLDVLLTWSAAKPVAANYGLSLSLSDVADNQWLQQDGVSGYDTQPGHGFLPTSLWPLGCAVHDPHAPALQAGIPPGDNYQLTITLYDVPSWRSIGGYTTPVALTKVTDREDPPVVAELGDDLRISEMAVPSSIWQGETLKATVYWSTRQQPSQDYLVEWRLQGTDHVVLRTQPLAPGSRPTAWPAGAWVAGHASLAISPTTPAGDYRLSLSLKDASGEAVLDTYVYPSPVRIRQRARTWDVPETEHRVGARFGGVIELLGYDLQQRSQSLNVTLHWKALGTPDRHYMFFVHLADPQTGEPVSQVDTMPRGFTYPTGQWAPGEVVSDAVALSTEDVAAGDYVLAVGWYNPDTEQRLPAVDADGKPLADGRVILPGDITIR